MDRRLMGDDAAPRGAGTATAVVVGAAFLVGVAGHAIGPSQRFDLLAPPLVGILCWNLVVYLALAVAALRRHPADQGSPGPWTRAWSALARRMSQAPDRRPAPLDPWLVHRAAAALHLAAAALALGALAGLYLRGLVLAYSAGWDSTFLDAAAVHAWLHALLGPAAALAGTSLPDAAAVEALRATHGHGENAARWIHLYALTTLAVVVLPRGLLAAAATWRAARERRRLQRVAEARADAVPLHAVICPYSYRLPAERAAALEAILAEALGRAAARPARVRLLPAVPMGDEDALGDRLPAEAPRFDHAGVGPAGGDHAKVGHASVSHAAGAPAAVNHAAAGARDAADIAWLPLFTATATPEADTHGRFVRALQARAGRGRSADAMRWMLLDESGLHVRLAPADRERRVAERRAAWDAWAGAHDGRILAVDLGPALART